MTEGKAARIDHAEYKRNLHKNNDSDLIRRSDAIRAIEEEYKGDDIWRLFKKPLMDIPAVEPKHGEWTNVGLLTVHCSNCKSEFHELEAMNFCPNCGVDMRKGADDD